MQLFVSNTTKQNTIFNYRLDPKGQVIGLHIAFGKQECIRDVTREQIDYIVSQHKGDTCEYMVEQKDIDMARGHIGLVYRIDKPVEAERTANTIETNDDVLDEQAAKLRKDTMSVIAANMKSDGKKPAALTSELIQEMPKGSEAKGLQEGIQVGDKKTSV